MNLPRLRSAAFCTGLVFAMIAMPALAQQLSATEQRGTSLSGQWQQGQGVVTHGPDGKVVFLFGQIQPSVVCSPLQVCDIELQPGEIVRDVLLGDTVRWKVEPATSGAPGSQAVHLIVKPSEPGLVNSSAEGDGWLWTMSIGDDSQLDGLMDADAYQKSIA